MKFSGFSFVVLLISYTFLSCSGNQNASAVKGDANIVSSNNATTEIVTHFSCKVNGVAVSGSGTDEMQLHNTVNANTMEDGSKQLKMLLFTSEYAKNTKTGYSFLIRCPDETGSFSKMGNSDHRIKVYLHMDVGGGPQFYEDSISVTIISLSATRVTGTFSGKLISDTYTSDHKRMQAVITDGVFDVPFSTSNVRL